MAGGAAYAHEFLPAMNHAFETLFAFPKPLVVAVNGHAIAGGCVMACCADYRIMAREPGRIGIPELLVGVPFPVVPLEIVRFATPPQHVQALIYRGLTLAADEALRYGLVDAVVDPDRLLDEAVAVADSLAAVPFEAFHLTKRLLREPAIRRMREGGVIDARRPGRLGGRDGAGRGARLRRAHAEAVDKIRLTTFAKATVVRRSFMRRRKPDTTETRSSSTIKETLRAPNRIASARQPRTHPPDRSRVLGSRRRC